MQVFLNHAKEQFLSDIKTKFGPDASAFCEQHILLFENITKLADFEPRPSTEFLTTLLSILALQNAAFTGLCRKLYPGVGPCYLVLLDETQKFVITIQEVTDLIDDLQQKQGVKINTDLLAELITPAQEKPKAEIFGKLFEDVLKQL